MLDGACAAYRELDLGENVLKGVKLTADAGLHSEANLKYLAEHDIDGYVADTLFRKRDVRFAQAARHKPTRDGEPAELFRPQDFRCAEDFSARRASGCTATGEMW